MPSLGHAGTNLGRAAGRDDDRQEGGWREQRERGGDSGESYTRNRQGFLAALNLNSNQFK